MPKEAARIFLRVTDVQVERVQEITEEDARAEGMSLVSLDDRNSWVFVYEFERCDKEGE